MKSVMEGLQWAKGLESQDGAAHTVDAKEVKSHIDIHDAESQDLSKTEDTETKANTDGGDEVKVKTDVAVSTEQVSTALEGSQGITIDAMNQDQYGIPKRFTLTGFNAQTNPAAEDGDNLVTAVLLMQNGVLPEVGRNGVTIEDLLRVVEETVVCYQESQFACDENEVVLQGVRSALGAIASRLSRRNAERTEGTYEGN